MSKSKIKRMLEQVARENHTTPQIVRKEMQAALDEAQSTTDPIARARWEAIPHKGSKVTLEEFLEYSSSLLFR